jgi:hypothetical protein
MPRSRNKRWLLPVACLAMPGPFNITRAAQYKNAENAVFTSGIETLTLH